MFYLKRLLLLSNVLLLIRSSSAAFFYPDPTSYLLEHILVDWHGPYSSGFSFAITPCTNYVSGNQMIGRETAAQWLRVAFHDAITARVIEGTGGMDASIGFETLREEDSGSAFNDSLTFFRPFVSSKVSMADLIALSVSASVGNCGGPQIPVRGGRVDATEGGAFGVPAPDTDLEETLGFFANAGFNQVDSIGLTACGHTMGSVHHGGFPTVVGVEAVNASNTAGGIHFDKTVGVFDPLVVHEYLHGTGNQGGPLVTSFNISSRSDLRLYESDINATMIKLANQGAGFHNTCSDLLQRMIEVVPNKVELSSIITPQQVKPVNATFDFDNSNNLIFKGYIRILTPTSQSAPTTLTMTTSAENKPIIISPESTTGSSVFGTTHFYPFSSPIGSSFQFFTITGLNIKQHTFPVQTQTFVVPSLSSFSTGKVSFAIASISRTMPNVSVAAPVPQSGTLGPAILTFYEVQLVSLGTKNAYILWEGFVDFGIGVTGNVTVEVWKGGAMKDLLILG